MTTNATTPPPSSSTRCWLRSAAPTDALAARRLPGAPSGAPIAHPATSDRNFYDRYYFNCHGSDDQLMLIAGMGQYPNLGVADAFVLVRHGDTQQVVRASKELSADRRDTAVGPIRVEVVEPLQRLRLVCEPNEWGLDCDSGGKA